MNEICVKGEFTMGTDDLNISFYTQTFINESMQLLEIFKKDIVEIHQLGNTAVKNFIDDGVVEIIPVVKNIKSILKYQKQLIKLGYKKFTIQNVLVFTRQLQQGNCLIIFVEESAKDILNKRLAMRDYLRMNAEENDYYKKQEVSLSYVCDDLYYSEELETTALNWQMKFLTL